MMAGQSSPVKTGAWGSLRFFRPAEPPLGWSHEAKFSWARDNLQIFFAGIARRRALA